MDLPYFFSGWAKRGEIVDCYGLTKGRKLLMYQTETATIPRMKTSSFCSTHWIKSTGHKLLNGAPKTSLIFIHSFSCEFLQLHSTATATQTRNQHHVILPSHTIQSHPSSLPCLHFCIQRLLFWAWSEAPQIRTISGTLHNICCSDFEASGSFSEPKDKNKV